MPLGDLIEFAGYPDLVAPASIEGCVGFHGGTADATVEQGPGILPESHEADTPASPRTETGVITCNHEVARVHDFPTVGGTSHVRRGVEGLGQASYRTEAGFLVAAVADGAGSAGNSALGAMAATRRAIRTATRFLLEANSAPNPEGLEDILRTGVRDFGASMKQMAGEKGEGMSSCACTLLATVKTRNLLGAAQIGDGGKVVSAGHGGFQPITSRQKGEYANQTTFLTSARGRSKWKCG